MVSIGHPLSQEFLDEYRRKRIASAVSELAHELRGTADLTVGGIATQAGASRGSVYALFEGKDDCLRYSCREPERRIFDPVREALAQPRPWPEQILEVITALLDATASVPLMAELCLIHASTVEGIGGSCLDAGVSTIRTALEGGRAAGRALQGAEYLDPPPCLEEMLANGVVFVIAHRLTSGRGETVGELCADMIHLCTLPFLGDEAAEELNRRGT